MTKIQRAIKNNSTVVTFGAVAIQQKGDIDRESEKVDRYIAGDHMASDDLHLRSWGVLNGQYLGPAFRRKFKKGDILYGSRRTYLKKVSIADFDGITANTTFVIKPNKEKICSGLLPFLMLSDAFTEHSVKHSKGSVNPYINWKDIANFSFKLPPIEDQQQVADLLWGIDASTEAYRKLAESLEVYSSAIFAQGAKSGKSRMICIGDIIESVEYGLSEKMQEKAKYPVLRMNNLNGGKINLQDLKYVDLKNDIAQKYLLKKNDILFNRTNSFDLVGKTSIFKENGEYLYASYLLRLRVKEELVDPDYLNYYMNSSLGMFNIRKYRTPGVSQSNVNAKNLLKVNVPICSMREQKEIIKIMSEVEIIKLQIHDQIVKNKIVTNTIVNQMMTS